MAIKENIEFEPISFGDYKHDLPIERDTLDVLNDNFKANNILYSVVDYASYKFSNDFPEDKTYTMDQKIGDMTGYENYTSSLMNANSRDEMIVLKSRIDEQNRYSDTLANATPMQKALSFGASILTDPTFLFGAVTKIGAVRNLVASGAVAQTTTVGKLMKYVTAPLPSSAFAKTMLAVTAEEAAFQKTQETRSLSDSLVNVMAVSALNTIVGKSGSVLSKAEKKLTEMQFTKEFDDVVRNAGSMEANPITDYRIANADKIKAFYKGTVPKFLQSPVLRMAESSSKVVTEFNAKLNELSLFTKANYAGKASQIPVETMQKLRDKFTYDNHMIHEDGYTKYAKRINEKGFAAGELKGENGILTENEFYDQIQYASIHKDVHVVPEIQETAQRLRNEIINPIAKIGEDSKLLGKLEDMETKTAESWMARIRDTAKINNNIPAYKERIKSNLLKTELTKEDTRVQLRDNLTNRKEILKKFRSTEKNIQRSKQSVEELAIREEEISRLNKFAYKRSEGMTKNLDELRQRAEELTDMMEDQLAQVDDLREAIRSEKGMFPELVMAEANINQLSRSLSKMKSDLDVPELLDGVDEISDVFDDLSKTMRDFISKQKDVVDEIKITPEYEAIQKLEDLKKQLLNETKPLRQELASIRKQINEEMSQKGDKAKGGAVFESSIRKRMNKIADKKSGQKFRTEALESKLEGYKNTLKESDEGLRGVLSGYAGKSADDAKSVIRRKTYGDAADRVLLRAARRLVSRTAKDENTINSLADEIVNREGRLTGAFLPYEEASSAGRSFVRRNLMRGSARSRSHMIPDMEIRDFLITDTRTLLNKYINTIITDSAILKNFDTLDVNKLLKDIELDYNMKRTSDVIETKVVDGVEKTVTRKRTNEEVKQLTEEMKEMQDLFKGTFERTRGTFDQPDNYMAPRHVLERALLNTTYAIKMPAVTIGSLADVGRIIGAEGFTKSFGKVFKSMAADLDSFKLSLKEMKELGLYLDMAQAVTSKHNMGIDDYIPLGGKVDKYTGNLADFTSKMSGIRIWNTMAKTIAGMSVQNGMLEAVEKLAKGGNLKENVVANLAANFIDKDTAKLIYAEFQKHGDKSAVIWRANSKNWNPEVSFIFDSAIRKQVDEIIIKAGQHKPLLMSRSGWKLIGQFKSFQYASNVKAMMAGFQRNDLNFYSGMIASMFVGSMSYIAREKLAGRKPDLDPRKLALEGIDRSGYLGSFFDTNNIVSQLTGGTISVGRLAGKQPLSRYANRNFLGSMLGPAYGVAQDLSVLTQHAFQGDIRQSDIHTFYSMLPMYRLPYMSSMFQALEEETKEGFRK